MKSDTCARLQAQMDECRAALMESKLSGKIVPLYLSPNPDIPPRDSTGWVLTYSDKVWAWRAKVQRRLDNLGRWISIRSRRRIHGKRR